ncbi:hypothetical protein [Desulfovibrio sp.]|uniref:hypothetical protein n=1 Tax=Desulfovibrio sp. TaxID=885 RepID=UPI003AB706E6
MPDTLLQDIYTFCSRIPLPLAKKLIALLRRDSSLWHAPASCKQQCGLNSELAALFQKLVRQSSSAKELAITLETGSFLSIKTKSGTAVLSGLALPMSCLMPERQNRSFLI